MISVNLSRKEDEEHILKVLSKKYEVNKSLSDGMRNISLIICDLDKLEEVNLKIKKIRRVSKFYVPIILVIVINNMGHKKDFSIKEVDYIIEINAEEEKIIDVVEKALDANRVLEDVHSKLESLLVNKRLGIFVQDNSGIILVNEKMKELIPDITHCKFVYEAFSSDNEEQLKKYFDVVANGPEDTFDEYIEVFLEKVQRWLLVYAAKTIFNNSIAIKGLAIDITESKFVKEELRKAIKEIKTAYENSIDLINSIVERRDPYTASHQRKVRELALEIAKELNLNEEKTELIDKASILHDIGKIFVPSEILNKPGKLSDFEMKMVKQHPEYSYELIMEANLNTYMANVVLQHHERLDGSGYPQGLTGDVVYYEAKILAVADVVEAMSSHRTYRPALGLEVALKEIQDNASKLYDQDVVNACLRVFEKGFTFSE